MRRFVAASVDDQLTSSRDDIVLAASELATLALLHAHADFEVEVVVTGASVRLGVKDADPSLPRPFLLRHEVEEGGGLAVIEAVADRWGVTPESDGKTVWCEFGTVAVPVSGSDAAGPSEPRSRLRSR